MSSSENLDPINDPKDQCKLMEIITSFIVGIMNFGGSKTICINSVGCAKHYSIISNDHMDYLLKYGEGFEEDEYDSLYLITDHYSRPIGVWSPFSKSFSTKSGNYEIIQGYKNPEDYNELNLLKPVGYQYKNSESNISYLKIDKCYIKETYLNLQKSTYIGSFVN